MAMNRTGIRFPKKNKHQIFQKHFFTWLLCAMVPLGVLAQFNEKTVLNKENIDEPFLNWGYYLGLNQYDFKFEYNNDRGPNDTDILVDKSIGFNVGLIGEMRLHEFLDLRSEPGLSYTLRTLGFPGFSEESNAIREVKSTYINFPLLLKINTRRFGNWKPFIKTGASASLNLGSNFDNPDDNSGGTFRMTKWAYNYELGFGIDFYLPYFKFTTSVRGVFGLNDELIRDANPASAWTSNIASMKTRALFIVFTFE